MVGTQFTRAERRTVRWMRRRGLGLQPTEEALEIHAVRLTVRFRVGVVVWPAFLVGFAWWTLATAPPDLDAASPWWQVVRTLVPVIVFAAVLVGFTRWCARADRHIAAGLPARVTRTGSVSARVVVGPLGVRALGVTSALEIAIAGLLAARATPVDAAAFTIGVVAVGLVCLLVLRVVLRRPTVAADATGLALDERLRALDALYALYPVGGSALALITPLDLRGVEGSGLVVALAGAAFVATTVLLRSHPAERVRYGPARAGDRA